jgi:hypothetical protein
MRSIQTAFAEAPADCDFCSKRSHQPVTIKDRSSVKFPLGRTALRFLFDEIQSTDSPPRKKCTHFTCNVKIHNIESNFTQTADLSKKLLMKISFEYEINKLNYRTNNSSVVK